MIDATVAPKVGCARPCGTTVCPVHHRNAAPQLRLEAGAQRTLEGVGSTAWCGDEVRQTRMWQRASCPTTRAPDGQRSLSDLAALGVRLWLAPRTPRRHARMLPLQAPACSLNRRSLGRQAGGITHGTRAATARAVPGS